MKLKMVMYILYSFVLCEHSFLCVISWQVILQYSKDLKPSEMFEFSSRCSEKYIGDVVGTSSPMSLKLHPRCIFHGIEDVFLAEFVAK